MDQNYKHTKATRQHLKKTNETHEHRFDVSNYSYLKLSNHEIKIMRFNIQIILSQFHYIEKILKQFEMLE